MTVVLTKPKTQVIWRSSDVGDKTTNIPGSDSSNNGYTLDIKTTLGNGDTHNVVPTSGTIGGLTGITFTDDVCNLFLRSDGVNNDWIIRCLCCYTPSPSEPVTCSSLFGWSNDVIADSFGDSQWTIFSPIRTELDVYGNYLIGSTVFDPSGTAIVPADFFGTDLADMIDAWFGSPIVSRTGGFNAGVVPWGSILQGQYILAYLAGGVSGPFGGLFETWFAVLQPSATGTPTLLGAIFYYVLTGNPTYGLTTFLVSNQQTVDDPLLVVGSSYPGGNGQYITMTVIPSITDIINGTFKVAGYPGLGGHPCRVPAAAYTFLGTNNLSNGLFAYNPRPNGNVKGIWSLPADDGGTNIYMYFSRGYIDSNAPGGVPSDVEIVNVIAPAYPLGCVVKIELGVLNYAALADMTLAMGNIGGTPGYTIDNANWVDSDAVVQVPFTDEYTYVSDGLPGGQDTYQMQPAAIIERNDGTWWIIMVMPGLNDSFTNFANTESWDTVRLFSYDPATEVFTQLFKQSCRAYVIADVPGPYIGSLRQDIYITASLSGSELHLDGYIVNNGVVYSVVFGILGIPV